MDNPTDEPVVSAVESLWQRELLDDIPYGDKLKNIHDALKSRYPAISRVAIALYDHERDLLKTFAHSSNTETPLSHYEFPLSESRSLSEMVRNGQVRVVNDMGVFDKTASEHARRIAEKGFGSSYTIPIFDNKHFVGFIFLNASEHGFFTPQVLSIIDPFISIISFITLKELEVTKLLCATVASVVDISAHRDPETGAHLQRMARYTRLIATGVAEHYGLNDEMVEHMFLFAPLHDVGKIGIPDQILLKPGSLDVDELETMRSHTTRGRQIVDRLIANFEISTTAHIGMLRNIIELHHETLDGSGYPHGLEADAIPIEARVVAVADIFDALTSDRPYKQSWRNEDAYNYLLQVSGDKLDPHCVEALVNRQDEVDAIQDTFKDDYYG